MLDVYDKNRVDKLVSRFKNKSIPKRRRSILKVKTSSKEQFAKRLRKFVSKYKVELISENRYNYLRKGMAEYPASGTYRKVFGSWKEALLFTFGKCNTDARVIIEQKKLLKSSFTSEINEVHLIRLLTENNIKNVRQYFNARKKYPDIFPPLPWIEQKFGGWRRLMLSVKALNIDEQIKVLIDMKRSKKGRLPKPPALKALGININLLCKKFGGYRKLNRLVCEMAVALEIKARNQRKKLPVNGTVSEGTKKEVFEQKFE